MPLTAQHWLQRIQSLALPDKVRLLNVCGGHERAITMAGLRGALPAAVELIPGPGCPVCICPEEDIYHAIRLALAEPLILVAFGDMLRVPVNVPKGECRTLEQARAAGADVRPIASPMEAARIARDNPDRQVVFFAAGFETTTAPVAALLAQGVTDNLSILLSARLTWPAVALLLNSGDIGFHALVAPGHVATIMGPEQWQFVVTQHHLPTAIAGFTPDSLLAAFYSILRQLSGSRRFLDNCYAELVRPGGNPTARAQLQQVMEVVDGNWRGIGNIAQSAFALRGPYQKHDARRRFADTLPTARQRAGGMPPGCDCARVVLGRIYPDQCRLYGAACTPRSPVGPCMVSDEGACRIWWAGGIRQRRSEPDAPDPATESTA
jgi:hydrogenase expression/formation protein HypD